ncbi:MAG: hypothetical protein RBT72_06155 [Spirochaetia bacterium]|jgi:hypothetical protein|nr:hypothetical protein [Spirochaetia bacterium]
MDLDRRVTGLSAQPQEQSQSATVGLPGEQRSDEGAVKGLGKSRSLIAGLAIVSFLSLALSTLALTATALLEAPQGIKKVIMYCLSVSSVGLFYFLSASFFFDLFCVFFKLEKISILRLVARLLLWLSTLIPLGLVWAVLRIMRGFQA